ncbi:hotdog family protein [Devosia aurantiaca]|uniref:MaoC-like domain-containing protein n=1 Tax=Devosia aurantiaca TaxID=2714858 RepID=A0A6M1T035_9HYPH|nr:hypothetical protein [Devosia aurantiaca]NGP18251.1 hypothetical protein [Devosia aurantiaca]
MTNPVTINRRHFEDLAVGEIIALGHTHVSKEMIITFARVRSVSVSSRRGGRQKEPAWRAGLKRMADGGLSLRMLVDTFLGKIASAGGLGFKDLKWKTPVMVGDTIGGTVTVAELRRSASHPQWGIVTMVFDVRNQKDKPVLTMRLTNLVECREVAA